MSLIKANDIQNASGGIPTVKGQKLIPSIWCRFDGTGGMVINDSEGCSSLIDYGVGNYAVNFTTALANTNYAAVGGAAISGNYTAVKTTITNSSRVAVDVSTLSTWTDAQIVSLVVMGGQA